MQGRAFLDSTKNYLSFLVRAALFPLTWLWAMALARRHSDTDPRARQKVLGAIAVGIMLTGAGGLMLWSFHTDARASMYDEVANRLSVASGNASYDEQLGVMDAKQITLGKLPETIAAAYVERAQMLANGTALADVLKQNGAIAALEANYMTTALDLELAQRNVARLQQEHAFFLELAPVVQAQDDARAQAMVRDRVAAASAGQYADAAAALIKAETGAVQAERAAIAAGAEVIRLDLDAEAGGLDAAGGEARTDAQEARDAAEAKLADAITALAAAQAGFAGAPVEAPVDPAVYDATILQRQSDRAFHVKDAALADMNTWMLWLLLPGLVGVFFAPLSFAVGNVLRNAWEPSDTVGFKEYPGGAMGCFLLLGAFGVPALFFAAWAFWDMDVRSREGQIAL